MENWKTALSHRKEIAQEVAYYAFKSEPYI